MIDKKMHHKERMKQAPFVPKPKGSWLYNDGNPQQMGEHQMQKGKHKRKKKR